MALHMSRTAPISAPGRTARGGRAGIAARAAGSSRKAALVPVAHGTEEMEAVIVADVLRRAGVDVCLASVESDKVVQCSRGVSLVADATIDSLPSRDFDLIAVPGGMPGSERLRDSGTLSGMLKERETDADRLTAAICAAPQVVLQEQGLFEGRSMTCHPGFISKLENSTEARVEIDLNLVTSRGPGTAFEFSLALVDTLLGEAKAAEVGGPMVLLSETETQALRLGAFAGPVAKGKARVLVPVANGTEEMEAVIMVDVLRRAGLEVVMASVESEKVVTCSREVKLVADETLNACASTSFDAILLPGGMPGATRLGESSLLKRMLADQRESGRLYGAICASPAVVLQANGLLSGNKVATSHPGFIEQLENPSEARVVLDGNCVTSRGPGTAFEFALVCAGALCGGEAKIEEVAGPMVMPSAFSAQGVAEKMFA